MQNTCLKCGKPNVTTELCEVCLMGTGKPYVNQQFENNFKYHSPKEGQPEKYEWLRENGKQLAYLFDALCPNSREKSLAITKLEEAIMWANASIARNE